MRVGMPILTNMDNTFLDQSNSSAARVQSKTKVLCLMFFSFAAKQYKGILLYLNPSRQSLKIQSNFNLLSLNYSVTIALTN